MTVEARIRNKIGQAKTVAGNSKTWAHSQWQQLLTAPSPDRYLTGGSEVGSKAR